MKTPEHIRRLKVLEQELIEFHERHRADKFDMTDFYREDCKIDCNLCETACCVAGLAGLVPEFRTAGLITYPNGNVIYEHFWAEAPPHSLKTSGNAAKVFFGLTDAEADELFYELYQNDSRLTRHTHLTKAAQVRAIIDKAEREIAAQS